MASKTITTSRPATLNPRDVLDAIDPGNTTWATYVHVTLKDHPGAQRAHGDQLDLLWCAAHNHTEGLAQHRGAANMNGALYGWQITRGRLAARQRELVRAWDLAVEATPNDRTGAWTTTAAEHLEELATLERQLDTLDKLKPGWGGYYKPLSDGQALRRADIGKWAEQHLLHRFHAIDAGMQPAHDLPEGFTLEQLVYAWLNWPGRRNGPLPRILDTGLDYDAIFSVAAWWVS